MLHRTGGAENPRNFCLLLIVRFVTKLVTVCKFRVADLLFSGGKAHEAVLSARPFLARFAYFYFSRLPTLFDENFQF